MTITMFNAGEKSSEETPTYIVTADSSMKPAQSGVQKKHVLIAVSSIVVVGLVIAGIMIGMHMFSEANKEIVKFSLQFKSSDNENVDQDVVADPNANVVTYHVNKNGQDVNVVNDFNRDIQVVKIESSEGTNCYISALNRTQAMDPSQIIGAASLSGSKEANGQAFLVSNTPVSDISFLTKKAKDICKGVSTYWAYRSCGGQNVEGLNMTTSPSTDRTKRSMYVMSPLYGMYGLGGCCITIYACEVRMTETIQGKYHNCQTYFKTGTCCRSRGGKIASPYCNNVYYGRWKTPGLVC
jgi:hypothetical protein